MKMWFCNFPLRNTIQPGEFSGPYSYTTVQYSTLPVDYCTRKTAPIVLGTTFPTTFLEAKEPREHLLSHTDCALLLCIFALKHNDQKPLATSTYFTVTIMRSSRLYCPDQSCAFMVVEHTPKLQVLQNEELCYRQHAVPEWSTHSVWEWSRRSSWWIRCLMWSPSVATQHHWHQEAATMTHISLWNYQKHAWAKLHNISVGKCPWELTSNHHTGSKE